MLRYNCLQSQLQWQRIQMRRYCFTELKFKKSLAQHIASKVSTNTSGKGTSQVPKNIRPNNVFYKAKKCKGKEIRRNILS